MMRKVNLEVCREWLRQHTNQNAQQFSMSALMALNFAFASFIADLIALNCALTSFMSVLASLNSFLLALHFAFSSGDKSGFSAEGPSAEYLPNFFGTGRKVSPFVTSPSS